MEYSARIGMWEEDIGVQLDGYAYELLKAHIDSCRVDLQIVVEADKLLIDLCPDEEGEVAVRPASRNALPYIVTRHNAMFSPQVAEYLGRSRSFGVELTYSNGSFTAEVDLQPHKRPWPKLRMCKLYNLRERAKEVMAGRIVSTAAAGDDWESPPDWFLKMGASFGDAWLTVPEGTQLRTGGTVLVR